MTKTLGLSSFWLQFRFVILNFGHWNLPFDLAQGGEIVEPFDIWYLRFGIQICGYTQIPSCIQG